jgi:hypothetical protein
MEQTFVFIVRLWHALEPQTAFRAAVMRAGTDESMWFTQSETLANYFEKQVRAPGDTHGRIEREEQS